MTNDPDLVLKSHGSVARDPTSWLRVGLGYKRNRETLLGLSGPPHCTQAHISTQPQSPTHCVSPANCLKPCPLPLNSISLQNPEGREPAPSIESEGPQFGPVSSHSALWAYSGLRVSVSSAKAQGHR